MSDRVTVQAGWYSMQCPTAPQTVSETVKMLCTLECPWDGNAYAWSSGVDTFDHITHMYMSCDSHRPYLDQLAAAAIITRSAKVGTYRG